MLNIITSFSVALGTLNNNSSLLTSAIQDNNGQFYAGIIGAAIGAILGAFATYLFALMIENRREKTQKKKDNELRERIALLIKYELDLYIRHLTIQYKALIDGVDIGDLLIQF